MDKSKHLGRLGEVSEEKHVLQLILCCSTFVILTGWFLFYFNVSIENVIVFLAGTVSGDFCMLIFCSFLKSSPLQEHSGIVFVVF